MNGFCHGVDRSPSAGDPCTHPTSQWTPNRPQQSPKWAQRCGGRGFLDKTAPIQAVISIEAPSLPGDYVVPFWLWPVFFSGILICYPKRNYVGVSTKAQKILNSDFNRDRDASRPV